MDIWFTLFVLFVAVSVASGLVLVLVGYTDSLVTSFAYGWKWRLFILAPLLLAIAAMVYGWREGAAVFIVSLAGAVTFCLKRWNENTKPGKQLLFGLALAALGVGLLYGSGPSFAKRVIDEAAQGNLPAGMVEPASTGSAPAPAAAK
ncbi:hypothetical protein OTERR_03300 [Oryzomicrobium terrae]|uniref:Uncharacterized protein n=1 Tax=Oryzomicrobium terrae TaxID=1735038 RepID=A0A5C1E4F5_9RHOO|nr:hypothetical protein [Oryzomicrobium terrae]QEL63806.1 hypothetical protein OTERR_03300 [Oryzomicrobium terrae]